jgi:hypothetical protein
MEDLKPSRQMRAIILMKPNTPVRAMNRVKTNRPLRANTAIKPRRRLRANNILTQEEMQMKANWTEIGNELNYQIKNYQGLTKQIVQIMNRAHAYGIDPDHEDILNGKIARDGTPKTQGLIQLKGVVARNIGRTLKDFPIWTEWLDKVPGIGPAIGGQLISLYYFKNIPICPKCGTDMEDFVCPKCGEEAKGNGVLKYRVELRDFPTISSWWHYMGRHVVNGKMPKRRKQEADDTSNPNDWSSLGRKIGFDIKESFNKQPMSHKYKAYAEKRKRYRESTHPEATKMHRHNMGWNEAVKLFLAHFWQVARTLDGLPLTDPWCVKYDGHDETSIIEPYYFDVEMEEAA